MDFSDEMFNLSSEKNLDEEVDKIFNFYRTYGFPHYDKNNYSLEKEYNKLQSFNEKTLFDGENKIIKQTMVGLGVLWGYFPHWIDVCCGSATKSLKELWEDDDLLKKLIKKTYIWKLKHNEPHWTNNRIRQNAKVYLSKQSVSNFRPTVAKYIYNTYGNNGNVFDMSAGFGGRLFGFMSSKCLEYVGVDPSTKTYNGLIEFKNDLLNINPNKSVKIIKQGSETTLEYEKYFDLCFTSPPYFDTEKYSLEETQSYKKYSTYNLWLDGFLTDTIKNCHKYLKDDGYMIINIADTPFHKLEEPTIKIAKNIGFSHIDTIYMELSSIAGKGKKLEPIFIFKK
jgi:16S rRNA G966 N2-methylase RsmD